MNILKSIIYTGVITLFLVSCKTAIHTIPVPNGADTILYIPAKKGALSETELHVWSHMDLQTDSIPGMSIVKAYQFLAGKKGSTVIVAIADSGIDVEHEDLRGVAWVNPNEIAGNNKDDDQNGYVDDVHGWNFLGNKMGAMVRKDQLELTRIVKQGMERFGVKKASEISDIEKAEFDTYLKRKEKYTKAVNAHKLKIENLEKTAKRITQILENFKDVKVFLGKVDLTVENLKRARPESVLLAVKIADVINLLTNGLSEVEALDYKKKILKEKTANEESKAYDLDFNARESLGDNLYDLADAFYGNNNVIGSKDFESHGTHVAGIVAAARDNGKGVNGVADNVKIMAVRVVPDGDEHDKDVALGIRYAVDNGAKVINTSFGKAYSPNKEWVYAAIKYAAKKDVLIVNAAGNDGKNIDVVSTFPNDSEDLVNEVSDNVLTIGAMSLHYNEKLPATFSNYGKKNVDVFAPGVDIYASTPKDEYALNSGTSMAAPSAAGVAALVRSYYPQLSASQVKHILMNSGIIINFEVIKPGTTDESVSFKDLSVSGRVINAYNALKMADRIVNGKK
ncbi:MAG: subtilisin family serine protease [Polaribacter sp.]|jgi:subtilisin family serine protease